MTSAPQTGADSGPAIAPGAPGSPASKVDRLVAELKGFGLTDVDAYRAAFCALALADGWSKARVGRYLGISRARVGQKAEKLADYAAVSPRSTPTLRHALAVAATNAVRGASTPLGQAIVAFKIEDWRDLEFARRVCLIPGR